MGYDDRKKFWFGTEAYSKWLTTPNSGAEGSPTGWNDGGTFLSGGGWGASSKGSHREYTFEWGPSGTYEAAQEMADFAAGGYGEGPFHFVLPTIYDKNILPSQWALPITYDAVRPLARGHEGTVTTPVASSGQSSVNFAGPWSAATADAARDLFIPIPAGYDLLLGVKGVTSGPGVWYYTPAIAAQKMPTDTAFSPGTVVKEVTRLIPGTATGTYAKLWIGSTTAVTGTGVSLTIVRMCARLVPSGTVTQAQLDGPVADAPAIVTAPWVGGMGNSGCEFIGRPSMVLNTGVNGGTASYAASFREVGTWRK